MSKDLKTVSAVDYKNIEGRPVSNGNPDLAYELSLRRAYKKGWDACVMHIAENEPEGIKITTG